MLTVSSFVLIGCALTAAAAYGFAHKLNIPIIGCPGVGFWTVQPEAELRDFPLGVMPIFGYSDLSNFLSAFLDTQGYEHLTLFVDESYAFYPVLAESLKRYIRVKRPLFSANAVIVPFLSKTADSIIFENMLINANTRSRGK